MKKLLKSLAGLVAVTLILSGCGAPVAGGTGALEPAEQTVTQTVLPPTRVVLAELFTGDW